MLNGHTILLDKCDHKLLEKCGKLKIDEIKEELSHLRIEYIEKIMYCHKCGVTKYPRTHHCSTCNYCIRRMDHHCVWIGNCLGLFNIKYFV